VPRVALVALAVALLAAGCGKPSPKVYSEVRTRACFHAKRLRITPPPAADFVATTALGGAFKLTLPHNFVTISFGDTVQNAESLDQVYRNVRGRNVGINDVLRTQGNAVMLWHAHPADEDLSLVQGCLKT
jgi:hypothetical protein